MAFFKSLSVILLAVCINKVVSQNFTLESPRMTNWGEWGPVELCAQQEYVYAFRLKVQVDQGIFIDDTALNGVELACISPQSKRDGGETKVAYLRSSEGGFGNWGTIYECPFPHFAVGFELRSEGVVLVDNTAANNFRVICSNDEILTGNGMGWGDWTGLLRCPTGQAICGLRTQVVERTPAPFDNTSVNNVDIGCCDRNL